MQKGVAGAEGIVQPRGTRRVEDHWPKGLPVQVADEQAQTYFRSADLGGVVCVG